MDTKKRVALVAHDNMKRDLAEWVDWNWEKLLQHHLICTGTTGKMSPGRLWTGAATSMAGSTLRFSSRVRWAETSSWAP